MSSRFREIASAILGRYGIPVADVHLCSGSSGANFSYWEQWSHSNNPSFHTDIETALGLMTTGRNDCLLLTPDSHSQADSITWNKNLTHLVGMYPPSMIGQRARIGHSANFTKLLDITGYGNFFANIELQYGRGNAANLIAMQVTGNRNTFQNFYVGGPFNATEADQAAFSLVKFSETSGGDGLEHYFKDCVFGCDTVAWTNGTMFKTNGTPRLVFENCVFLMRADNAQVTFINGTAGDGQGFILFKNCTGINLGTALTYAIGSTGIAAATDYILHNSGFTGVTDLIAAADEAKAISIASVGAAADDINIGLGIPFDHTA
jgi:hypothetical protein